MPGQNNFLPKPGRFGVMPALLTARLEPGTLAAGTVVHSLGSYPGVPAQISALAISAAEWPTAATSAVMTLQKYDASANAAVTLTAGIDINNLTDREAVAAALLSTLTVAQLTFDVGDTLEASVVITGAVSVQPRDLVVAAEFLVLR